MAVSQMAFRPKKVSGPSRNGALVKVMISKEGLYVMLTTVYHVMRSSIWQPSENQLKFNQLGRDMNPVHKKMVGGDSVLMHPYPVFVSGNKIMK